MLVKRWLKALAAVLLGNAIYFLLVMPHVPEWVRHRPFHADLGLLIDLCFCIVCYIGIELIG
jgi:hypothetical protein